MSASALTAAFIKTAFKLHPFDSSEMALAGGLTGGALGGGVGALTGLIGTQSGTPERRKAMINRALIGLLGGGAAGALAGNVASENALLNQNLRDMPDLTELRQRLQPLALFELGNQAPTPKGVESFKRLLADPNMLNKSMDRAIDSAHTDMLKNVEASPSSALKILMGADMLAKGTPLRKEITEGNEGNKNLIPPNVKNIVWDAIKANGLDPNR